MHTSRSTRRERALVVVPLRSRGCPFHRVPKETKTSSTCPPAARRSSVYPNGIPGIGESISREEETSGTRFSHTTEAIRHEDWPLLCRAPQVISVGCGEKYPRKGRYFEVLQPLSCTSTAGAYQGISRGAAAVRLHSFFAKPDCHAFSARPRGRLKIHFLARAATCISLPCRACVDQAPG